MNTTNKKFKLSHVALYAKGWYHATDNIWRDLRFALTLDGYSGEFFKNKDIVRKLLQECSELNKTVFTMDQIYIGIQKLETFKYGYIHKDSPSYCFINMQQKDIDNLPEYDNDMAFVKYLISNIRFLTNNEWEVVKPKYGNKLGKPYCINKKDVEDLFA